MQLKYKNLSFLVIIILSIITLLFYYCYANYMFVDSNIKSIGIIVNEDVKTNEIPIMYVRENGDDKLNYLNAYKFKKVNDSVYLTNLPDSIHLRSFRLYFEVPNVTVSIRKLQYHTETGVHDINLKHTVNFFKAKGDFSSQQLNLWIDKTNAFLEPSISFFYKKDFKHAYLFITIIVAISLLLHLVMRRLIKIKLNVNTYQEISVLVLLASIFLPAPIYNIALIVALIFKLKNFNIKKRLKGNIELLIIGFFLIYFFNNIFISPEGYQNMSTIERFLPFIVLPFILNGKTNRKNLVIFPVFVLLIGFGFLVTSIFDTFIYDNLVFLSFDYFSKYLHPVYFSYVLFFSICYLQLYWDSNFKYIIQGILIVFLLLSGSKLVLLFSLFAIVFNIIKNKKIVFFTITIGLLVVLLFKPLRNRFGEILNTEDMSVLKEQYLKEKEDSRINGLTLRLILWREALATMDTKDYFFGKGVTKSTNKILENRLINLGMIRHKSYNPHNQYIDTLWRTGLLGLLVLILIPLYSFIIGLKNRDLLLIQFSLFLVVVMFSESIFGRVNGIYFFTTVILILINSSKLNENSNTRNEGYTQ